MIGIWILNKIPSPEAIVKAVRFFCNRKMETILWVKTQSTQFDATIHGSRLRSDIFVYLIRLTLIILLRSEPCR